MDEFTIELTGAAHGRVRINDGYPLLVFPGYCAVCAEGRFNNSSANGYGDCEHKDALFNAMERRDHPEEYEYRQSRPPRTGTVNRDWSELPF